eukprot:TRINITY_DN38452_c0_g1_i1.p1 TRINITY_DN38452_c0_g1~~TRINITY_DN38452_c0_g1_i1.p1  ORF type:complete len:217 (-),score=15.51 TRINITY_DN38452_c0_g1_i1:394-1044(-)
MTTFQPLVNSSIVTHSDCNLGSQYVCRDIPSRPFSLPFVRLTCIKVDSNTVASASTQCEFSRLKRLAGRRRAGDKISRHIHEEMKRPITELSVERTHSDRINFRVNASDGNSGESSGGFDIRRLEAYTEKVPREVLLVHAKVEGEEEEDEVLIFKGFSSSVVRPTASDPSEPILPEDADILGVDRIRAPYNPSNILYIQQGVAWKDFDRLLSSKGL